MGVSLRVVYLANFRWPRVRGAERLLLALLEHGRSRGHEVTVIVPRESALHEACREIGVPTVAAEFSPLPWKLVRLHRALVELRPDVVQGWSIFPVALADWFRLIPDASRVARFAYVSTDPTSHMTIAAPHFQRTLLAMRNFFARWEAPRLDGVFVPSETVARLLQVAGIHGRVILVQGVIDIGKMHEHALSPLPVPEGRPRIGYAAFLEKLKGIDDLVTAFAEVRKGYPAASLVIAGDGPEKEALQKLAGDLGVAESVHMLGFVEPIAGLLVTLDLYVSPSHTEARPNSILEAMAIGIPCVCTGVGGVPELVHHEKTGLLVPAGDPPALAAAIERVLGDPELAVRLAQNARAFVAGSEYAITSTLETVFAEYDQAARRRRGGIGT